MVTRFARPAAIACALCAALADADSPPAAPSPVSAKHFSVTLDDSAQPVSYVVRYRGARQPFEGPVCYWFEGYSETCLTFELGMLSSATELRLAAPGGVPIELLRGYTLNLRLPGLSSNVLRIPLQS